MTHPISFLATESKPIFALSFPGESLLSKIVFSQDFDAGISASLPVPSMTLFFTLQPSEVTNIFKLQKTSASYSLLTDTPAYNTVVKKSSALTTSFSFLGNLFDTLPRLLACEILSEEDVSRIQNEPKIESLLSSSKSWFVSLSGELKIRPADPISKAEKDSSFSAAATDPRIFKVCSASEPLKHDGTHISNAITMSNSG